MDERKEFLTTVKICRFCLSQEELSELYDNHQGSKRTIPFALKILSTVSVEIFPSDNKPQYICSRCKYFMGIFYDYKQLIRGTDEAINHYLQSDTQLEKKPWPKSLGKIFRLSCKAKPKTAVMKTVVEGGATIEVTQSQEASESEDGEEDLYSVKIEDGSQELKSATVKVVTPKEDPKEKNNKKDSEFESDSPGKVTPSSSCWACDECESTYPLHQLLELHKMKKHRNRMLQMFPCNKCNVNVKYSSKQDLENHILIKHTLNCMACGLSFQQPHVLRRHERLNHPELLTHKCQYCPEIFLSDEILQEHLKRHKRYVDESHTCDFCDKRFPEETSLRHHQETTHSTLICEYCPQRFNSVTKLARHVRTHAGEKQYPCKYCDKAFIKSHHYTRHLQIKHADERMKQENETASLAENYQCEQCGSSFTSQDDLIYHSAIHATQNLICPLCQEKFQDVDSVTTHIKSHVPETEYQCDFCELVFTSKNKLELHLITVHEDQLQQQEQDESSMDVGDEEDDTMNIKQDGDEMIVEIKKPDDFMITNPAKELQEIEEYDMNNSQSDDSDHEMFGQESEESPKPNFEKAVASPAKTFASLVTVSATPTLYSAPTTPTAITVPKTLPVSASVSASTISKETLASITPIASKAPAAPKDQPAPAVSEVPGPKTLQTAPAKTVKSDVTQSPSVLRKTEEVKRKVTQQSTADNTPEKKDKSKVESSGGGASDKSLRLLEKELQELKRTNTRNESPKTPAKAVESLRSRRPQIHTSTPKLRSAEEKKSQAVAKLTPPEKKVPERRAVKENKKPDETKEAKNNSIAKDDKDAKHVKEKEVKRNMEPEEKTVSKDKEDPKEKIVKNGNKSTSEEGVRRSSRPSRIKDYAKMIRERTETAESDDDDTDDDDEEYDLKEDEKTPEVRTKRKSIPKQKPQAQPVKVTPMRKRGRPRKEAHAEIPAKVRKDESEEEDSKVTTKPNVEDHDKDKEKISTDSIEEKDSNSQMTPTKSENTEKKPEVLVAPSGQTLKKVPIKSLPPGIKPMPLPANARPVVGTSETCEMQIGKKVVKVQKIVMTKAEVEAMAKKGLLEMKDGTMVLKQGIKLATTDAASLKSTLVGEEIKESPSKEKSVPTRCNLDEQ